MRRKRAASKMEVIVTRCCCAQFGYTTMDGLVPEGECPLKCIDDATGHRYGFDAEGNCLCPICSCMCSACYCVSSFAIYSL
jgi:hypothetical protein